MKIRTLASTYDLPGFNHVATVEEGSFGGWSIQFTDDAPTAASSRKRAFDGLEEGMEPGLDGFGEGVAYQIMGTPNLFWVYDAADLRAENIKF